MQISDKYSADEYVIDEEKFPRNSSLRNDVDFFDEDSCVAHDVISVKRIGFKTGEDWEIYKNNKTALILKGVRFTKKEKNFLRTIDGVQFLIQGYKSGWKSVSEFKRNLKGKV